MPGGRAPSRATPIDRKLLRAWLLPLLPPNADKAARGDVLVVGGSREVPGAVLLAGVAALRAGAGRLQLGAVRSLAPHLAVACPEARVLALPEAARGELARSAHRALGRQLERCRALLLGPGMSSDAAIAPLLDRALARRERPVVVLDAAALRALKRRPGQRGQLAHVIATPHAGEMAELWGASREAVEARRVEIALEAARELGITLLLKGSRSVVATPEGRAYESNNGNVGLATSGSGDVLSGIIAGLAARGASPAQAAVWGVYLHGAAGDALARRQGLLGYLARELSAEVPALLAGVR